MRRVMVVCWLVAMLASPVSLGAVAVPGQAPETVGIRLVEAPTSRQNDPRARDYIIDHLAPGTTINRRVEVNNDTKRTVTVQLYAAAADISGGEFHFGEGHAANDLTRWTTVNPPSLTLAPAAKGQSTVTIAVARDASAGERYGVVWAELPAAVPTGGGISTVNRVGIRMYLSVGPGGEPAVDFAITSMEARRGPDGTPVVAATVRNTGGRAIDLSGELRLAEGPGGLSAGPFAATLGRTLGPGQSEAVLVSLDRAIPNGPWTATIVLRSGTTERTASARITFPGAPGTSTRKVATSHRGGRGRSLVIAGLGLAIALVLLVFFLVLPARRRRREPRDADARP
jgi:hypothetical protein